MRTICLAICLLFSISSYGIDINPDEFKIYKIYTNDSEHEFLATAFYVSEHKLLTAAHTFKHTETITAHHHFLLVGSKYVPVKIEKIDYDQDICVLYCGVPASAYILAATFKKDEAAALVGYPHEAKKLTYYNYIQKSLGKFLTFKGEVPGGTSGGPVIGKSGTVIGMIVNGDENVTNTVPAKTLIEFLGKP